MYEQLAQGHTRRAVGEILTSDLLSASPLLTTVLMNEPHVTW